MQVTLTHTRTTAFQTRGQLNNLLREQGLPPVDILGADTQDIAFPVLACQENQFSHWRGIKTEGGPRFRIFYARQEKSGRTIVVTQGMVSEWVPNLFHGAAVLSAFRKKKPWPSTPSVGPQSLLYSF